LIATDEINIPTLIHYIQEYLIKNQDEFLQQSSIEILELAYQYETFTELLNLSLKKICYELDKLFSSDKFINLKPPLLELILKRDDLSLDEIIIWDNLIKWCLGQHSNISQDPTQWDENEIEIMEVTIHRFIPLIRIDHISSVDFINRVYPFKEIMPKDLVNNYHMVPNNVNLQPSRQPKVIYDSILIKSPHFAIISGWIEKIKGFYYNTNNIPYNFKLIFRASRDGNTSEAFHAKCDYKEATIVIVKISNSEHIVGGYNPLFWDSNSGWKFTKDSFIFSFTNRNNFQTAKVGHVTNANYAIQCSNSYGPTFGGGIDLFQSINNTWKSHTHSYPEIDIPQGHKKGNYYTFDVENYEVFQVIKK
jgi:hypothetical protein